MLERDELRIKAAKIIFHLEEMAYHDLFVRREWPPDGQTSAAVWLRFKQMGLAEPVPGMKNSTQYTELGKACRVDLFVAFMGAIETWDIPHTLLENGLIDDVDAERIWLASSETEAVRLLKAAVTRSYHFVCAGPRTIN